MVTTNIRTSSSPLPPLHPQTRIHYRCSIQRPRQCRRLPLAARGWRNPAASYDDESGDAWLSIADVERVAHDFLEELFQTHIDDVDDGESSTTPVIYTSLVDGLRLRAFWAIFRELGYGLSTVARRDSWLAALQADVEKTGEQHPLWPVLPSLGQEYASLGRWRRGVQAAVVVETREQVDSSCDSRTERVKETVQRTVLYLVKIGFLPSPGGERRVGVEVGLEEGKGRKRELSNGSRNGWLPRGGVRMFDGVASDISQCSNVLVLFMLVVLLHHYSI